VCSARLLSFSYSKTLPISLNPSSSVPCRVVTIAAAAAKQMSGFEELWLMLINGVQFGVSILTQFDLFKMLPGYKNRLSNQVTHIR
jgi:hypothetical protein